MPILIPGDVDAAHHNDTTVDLDFLIIDDCTMSFIFHWQIPVLNAFNSPSIPCLTEAVNMAGEKHNHHVMFMAVSPQPYSAILPHLSTYLSSLSDDYFTSSLSSRLPPLSSSLGKDFVSYDTKN